MQRFDKTTEGVKNQLAAEFAPYLEESTEKLTKFVGNLGKALKDSGVVDAFGMLLETFTNIIVPADYLSDDAVPKLTESLKPLATVLALIGDTMTVIAGLIEMIWGIVTPGSGHFTSGIDNIKTGMGWNVANGKPSNMYRLEHKDALEQSRYDESLGGWVGNYDPSEVNTVVGYTPENKSIYLDSDGKWYDQYGTFIGENASGNYNWRGGTTWVGENGPEKVFLPQGSRILNAQESRETVGDTIVYVTIDAKNVREFHDVVRIVREAQMKARKDRGD